MSPNLRECSTVGIDRLNIKIKDGDMYVISHASELRVKILYKLPQNGLRIRSYNREKYPDESYTEEDVKTQEIFVYGRVFWSSTLY